MVALLCAQPLWLFLCRAASFGRTQLSQCKSPPVLQIVTVNLRSSFQFLMRSGIPPHYKNVPWISVNVYLQNLIFNYEKRSSFSLCLTIISTFCFSNKLFQIQVIFLKMKNYFKTYASLNVKRVTMELRPFPFTVLRGCRCGTGFRVSFPFRDE